MYIYRYGSSAKNKEEEIGVQARGEGHKGGLQVHADPPRYGLRGQPDHQDIQGRGHHQNFSY